jgi:hypothetical protein
MARKLTILGPLALLCGCIVDATSSGGPTPVDHTLASAVPLTIKAGSTVQVTFDVPTTASFTWSLADRSSTSPDTFSVKALSESEYGNYLAGQPTLGYASKKGTAPDSASDTLPAGGYHLLATCTNLLENCEFAYTLVATY